MSRISDLSVPTIKPRKWTTREHASYWRLQQNWLHRASVANLSYRHDVRFDWYWQRSMIDRGLPRNFCTVFRLTPALREWKRRWNLDGRVAKCSDKHGGLHSGDTCLVSQSSAHFSSPVYVSDNESYVTYIFKIPAKLFPISFINIISSVCYLLHRTSVLSAVLTL
jgi:hypothetical protein